MFGTNGIFICIGNIIPFFVHTVFEFGKNANSKKQYVGYHYPVHLVLCSSNRVCVFRCVASVAHLFIIIGGEIWIGMRIGKCIGKCIGIYMKMFPKRQ